MGYKSLKTIEYEGKMVKFAFWYQLWLLSLEQDTGTDRHFV